ncbi:MAG: Spy/CpxP family protein refolding chaperone [Pseudomonadota bacterium]
MTKSNTIGLVALLCASAAIAQDHGASPHAGKQAREIASLSDQDIAAIRAGTGWGMALPAEINGAPGPRHVLDLAEQLELTDSQITQVTAIFDEMKRSALTTGDKFIAAEKALNDAFVRGGVEQAELENLVSEAGKQRAALRLVHLATHLKTLPVLTDEQVERYSALRGYTDQSNDPCASVPEGHDPVMWKKHNGCSGG